MKNYNMTFEEYKEAQEELDRQRKQLAEQSRLLRAKYIEEHREFKDGDKVRVWTGSYNWSDLKETIKDAGVVFIPQVKGIDHKGNVTYQYVKQKKDGTPSHQSAGMWFVSKIELVNEG
jgi:hypothetical protein